MTHAITCVVYLTSLEWRTSSLIFCSSICRNCCLAIMSWIRWDFFCDGESLAALLTKHKYVHDVWSLTITHDDDGDAATVTLVTVTVMMLIMMMMTTATTTITVMIWIDDDDCNYKLQATIGHSFRSLFYEWLAIWKRRTTFDIRQWICILWI